MGAAVTAALVAAAAQRERAFIAHFVEQGATTPAHAVPLPAGADPTRGGVRSWLRRGILHPSPGGYWFDQAAYDAERGRARRAKVVVIAVLLALLVLGVLFNLLRSPGVPVNL